MDDILILASSGLCHFLEWKNQCEGDETIQVEWQ
jgi:hypothetical protein